MASRYQKGLSSRTESSCSIFMFSMPCPVVTLHLLPYRSGQVSRKHVPGKAPLPVAEGGAGNIHARLASQFQNILKRYDSRISNRHQCGARQVADAVIP